MAPLLLIGLFSGQKFLDFGCGSVVQCAIGPSRYFDQIYFADFPKNLEGIECWINRNGGAQDWSYFFQEYAKLEG